MKKSKFKVGKIIVDYFYSKDNPPEKIALFLYGFPYSLGANEVTKFLVEEKFGVIQMQYPGTNDSEGAHEPETAINSVSTLINSLSDTIIDLGKNVKVQLPNKIPLVVGYSFGGFVAVNSVSFLPDLESLILISPTITFGINTIFDSGVRESFNQHIPYVKRTRPLTYRLGNLKKWEKLYSGFYDTNTYQTSIKCCSIFGANDSTFEKETLMANYEKVLKKKLSLKHHNLIIDRTGSHKMSSLNQELLHKCITEVIND